MVKVNLCDTTILLSLCYWLQFGDCTWGIPAVLSQQADDKDGNINLFYKPKPCQYRAKLRLRYGEHHVEGVLLQAHTTLQLPHNSL